MCLAPFRVRMEFSSRSAPPVSPPRNSSWSPTLQKDGSPRRHAIPGHEFSGTVAELGSDVREFAVGDAVFGMNDWFADGATAEFCVAAVSSMARKPQGLSFEQAAAVPIGALTAWQGLVDRAHLRAGDRLLVHGAAGAVGVFAVQSGVQLGAEVIATASARHRTFLRDLGARQVIDYTTEPFDQKVRDLDVVFDTVGGETLRRSWPLLKPGGHMVTIASEVRATGAIHASGTPSSSLSRTRSSSPTSATGSALARSSSSLTRRSLWNRPQPPSPASAPRAHGYGKVVVTLPCG